MRAFAYLEALDCGEDKTSANSLAEMLFKYPHLAELDRSAILRAIIVKGQHFDGKQLPIIQLTRRKGFAG